MSTHAGTPQRNAVRLPAEVALFALAGDSAAVLDRDGVALKLTAESDHKVGHSAVVGGNVQRTALCSHTFSGNSGSVMV